MKRKKQKLQIAIMLVCVAYASLSATFYLLFYKHQQALEKMAIAQDLSLNIFERRYLADEYITTQSERSKSQWFSNQKTTEEKLSISKSLFQSGQEKAFMKSISDGIFSGEKIFNQMVVLYDDKAIFSDSETILTRGRRLSSQLSIWTQEAISAATGLADFNNKNVIYNSQRMLYLFLSGALFLFTLLIGSFWIIWQGWKDLYSQKTKNELILGGIGDGIIVVGRDWKILLFNKAASNLSGWSEAEVIGRPFREVIKFIREKDRGENIEFIERAMLFGKVNFMENHTFLKRKDGREIPVGDSAAPLSDEDGSISGAIVIFRDVSKERESNLLKSDFAYASHQFRTPINKALWGLEAALEEFGADDKHENIKNSLLALKSINKLSQSLLEISEIDQGQIIPEIRRIRINEVVRESVELIKESAVSRNIAIDTEVNDSEFLIEADPRLLKKCLYEVLNNAILYSKSGDHVKLNVHVQNDEIFIRIKDPGRGIPEKEQPLIFKKFFRGSNFDTTEVVGAGLGLYVAKKYINIIKGKIWFKSKENSGTEFFISLPAIK